VTRKKNGEKNRLTSGYAYFGAILLDPTNYYRPLWSLEDMKVVSSSMSAYPA
jgi:hypothetical protein